MAEERRFQAPRLCANNCGFFGSPATQDLCSKCYRDLQLKEQQSSSAAIALNQTLGSTVGSSTTPSPSISTPARDSSPVPSLAAAGVEVEVTQAKVTATPNRCSTCRRRVGLTGFKCRCGLTYCGSHRYPEQHSCGFDFKGTGREQISRANPVVKAPKLDKI